LAHDQDDCEWRRYDEFLVSRARSFEAQELMGGACLFSLNRPVRTRMPLGCGEIAQGTGILTRFCLVCVIG
jgi:hypothetical protein